MGIEEEHEMLSAAQMAQMSRLLEQALELDPEGRRRWLEALPAEHRELEPALRRALLRESDQVSASSEPATLPKVGAWLPTGAISGGLQPGERVGPYLLVRPLGAGGMAEVWLAQRADGAFKREVALKLPMLSRLRKDLAQRFAHERDILAALEHPNIARMYDAGLSADQLPYLAMEYVHGEPLISWCNAHRLGIRARLKLFLQVLDAVQYAHDHQVIHRDIKPSNILVTDSGQVRLLDFGVAKLLAHEDEQTELTQIYGRALTPEYASPELLRGEAIDAAADVYSLGVVLCELLSGRRPNRIKGSASMVALEQAPATGRLERPSSQLGPEAGTDRGIAQNKLARRLRGDLDAVVLKALAQAPKDRYASAAALADDLQRYLSGDPLKARLAGPAYLIGKFVRRRGTKPRHLVTGLVIALLLASATLIWVLPWQKREHARNALLPALQEMTSKMVRSNGRLLEMAMEAEEYLPNDPTLAKLWPVIASTLSIETTPGGAEVFWKDYETPDAAWRFAGVTPLKEAKVPRNLLRVEIRKKGYQTIEMVSPRPYTRDGSEKPSLKMDPVGSLPENMVRIPASTTEMNVVGLERYGGTKVPEFLVDKFEVTNKQFKAFVDAGGYTNAAYWRVPIAEAGKVIPLALALSRFKDRTGRPGPAAWEAGTYPDGMENHPVTGVSWYEAAAYAEYAKKQLPTVFHWAQIADTARTEFLIPFSNFSEKSTSAVGSLPGVSSYGVYDVAGNAREWVFNSSPDPSQRFILGGGWTDPTYAFNDSYTQPALDRGPSNGIRCVQEPAGAPQTAEFRKPVSIDFRDYTREKPVDDRTFAIFSRQFAYDKKALDAKVDRAIDSDSWKAEVVSINAGYGKERMQVYVFLPLHVAAPLQPVIYFPGSQTIFESRFDPKQIDRVDFIVKSGRALVYPIYKGTFERQDSLKSDLEEETVAYKDHVIMWAKDLARTIDYLETRKDMRPDEVAFLGISWGGVLGGILPAVDKRIKVVVLNVGGMPMQKALPEADQINYLPRITQPVLMLNGKYDMYFPVETSQKPMFNLLGTPKNHKKMVVYASGHRVPQVEFIKETLAWLDTYLGPAE